MNATHFLIETIFDLYLMVVLLRFWLQTARADFYNPFSQFVVKATNPVLVPLRKVIPGLGGFDLASIILALMVAALKLTVISAMFSGQLEPIGILIGSFFVILKEAFNLVFWIVIIRAIMSWVSQGHNPMEALFSQLTEPMLAPIRKIIPPMGGLDLSIMVFLIGLKFVEILLQDLLRGMF